MDENDRQIVLLAAEGDAEAFTALVAPRRTRLLSLLASTMGDWHEAGDALQEVLWTAFRQLRRPRAPLAFDAWLRTAAINAARNRLQATVARMRREGRPGGDLTDLQPLLDATAEAATNLLGQPEREDCAPILDAIAELPAPQRRAGNLASVAGVRPGDIASLLGISTGNVHVTLHRARTRLDRKRPFGCLDWRRETPPPSGATVLIGGYTADRLVGHPQTERPDLPTGLAAPHEAHVFVAPFQNQPPLPSSPAPPGPAEALPLEGLAETTGFELEPFGDRLLRHCWGARPCWLPHHARLRVAVYNADVLCRAGLPLPPADWTWDEFFGYCRRCAAVGAPGVARPPGGPVLGHIAEQLGGLEAVREAAGLPPRVEGRRPRGTGRRRRHLVPRSGCLRLHALGPARAGLRVSRAPAVVGAVRVGGQEVGELAGPLLPCASRATGGGDTEGGRTHSQGAARAHGTQDPFPRGGGAFWLNRKP